MLFKARRGVPKTSKQNASQLHSWNAHIWRLSLVHCGMGSWSYQCKFRSSRWLHASHRHIQGLWKGRGKHPCCKGRRSDHVDVLYGCLWSLSSLCRDEQWTYRNIPKESQKPGCEYVFMVAYTGPHSSVFPIPIRMRHLHQTNVLPSDWNRAMEGPKWDEVLSAPIGMMPKWSSTIEYQHLPTIVRVYAWCQSNRVGRPWAIATRMAEPQHPSWPPYGLRRCEIAEGAEEGVGFPLNLRGEAFCFCQGPVFDQQKNSQW